MALDSTFIVANELLGTIYLFKAARLKRCRCWRLDRSSQALDQRGAPGLCLCEGSLRPKAEALLRELLERQSESYISPSSIALLTAGLGDTSETFAWLERGRDPRSIASL